jgi:hypothetical protein
VYGFLPGLIQVDTWTPSGIFIGKGAELYLNINIDNNNIKIQTQRTIIFHVVLYGCKTWSVKTGDQHRLGFSRIGC